MINIICCSLFSKCSFLNYFAIRSTYYISINMRAYRIFIDTCAKFFEKHFDYFEYREFLSSILIFENLNKYLKLTTLFIRKRNELRNRTESKRTRDRESNKRKERYDRTENRATKDQIEQVEQNKTENTEKKYSQKETVSNVKTVNLKIKQTNRTINTDKQNRNRIFWEKKISKKKWAFEIAKIEWNSRICY